MSPGRTDGLKICRRGLELPTARGGIPNKNQKPCLTLLKFVVLAISWSGHLYLARPNPKRPKKRPPDAIAERRPVSRNNPSFSRQALNRAVDNGAELGGVPLLASPCQSTACILNAEPGGVAFWFLRSLGVSDFQHKSLHDGFLDAIAQAGVAS